MLQDGGVMRWDNKFRAETHSDQDLMMVKEFGMLAVILVW
jgi:hypothetical protein